MSSGKCDDKVAMLLGCMIWRESKPPFGTRAKDSIDRSMSLAFSTGLATTSIPSDGAMVLAVRKKWP